jgi:hypothetical protein
MVHIYLVCVQPKKSWKYNLVLPNSAHAHRPPRVDWYIENRYEFEEAIWESFNQAIGLVLSEDPA